MLRSGTKITRIRKIKEENVKTTCKSTASKLVKNKFFNLQLKIDLI